MPTSATYYLNGPTLGSSTAIFLNSGLTVIAPDGFYSDGVTSRELLDGILLPPSTCNSCGTPCGESILASGASGVYLVNLDAGSTPSDIGAILVRFNPQGVPDGIKAVYNGNTYNALTSLLDGFHQSTDPDNFTVVGNNSFDCALAGNTTNLPDIAEYLYNGTSFVATGNTQNITLYPGDISLSANNPGPCLMVIPKTTASPNIINFEFIGPCTGTAWNINIGCPQLLTGFSSTVMSPTSFDVCSLTETETYYNASLTNTPGVVGLYDFVYSDAFGVNPLAPGFYKATDEISFGNDWFEVDANGVVIDLGLCI